MPGVRMKKLINKLTDAKKPANLKEWENPLLPMFYTLKVLGRLPFEKDESGCLGFRLLSAPSVWALVATSFQLVVVVKVFILKLTSSENWTSFNLAIANLQELFILCTAFHAFITWSHTPAITRAFNRWLDFHKKFHTTVGREVVSPILLRSYWGVIFSVLFVLVVLIIAMLREKVGVYVLGLELLEAIYCICIFYFNIIVWTWLVYCLMVIKAAEILTEHIKQQTLSHHLTAEELAELRLLWVELHACTVAMSEGIGQTIISTQLVSYLITLFSLYAGLMYVLVDNSFRVGYIPFSLFHSHIACILVYTLGHIARQSMNEDFLFLLYSKHWQSFDSSVRTELDLLLDAIEMNPCFEIRGLLTLNRHGYIEVLNRILTYLIILMQIRVSADGVT